MAKDKKGSKAAAPAPTPQVSKPIESVKSGRVAKAAGQTKSSAKDIAKKTGKKAKKEPTPEPSSEDDDSTSASSVSSNSESEVETKPKVNGSTKEPAAKKDESDVDSSEASDSDEEDAPKKAPKLNGGAKAATKANGDGDDASSSEGTSEGTSEGSDSDSDDGGVDTGAQKLGAGIAKAAESSGSDSDSSDGEEEAPKAKGIADTSANAAESSEASSSEDDSESDDEEKEKPKAEEVGGKKRKADEAIDQTPKKTRVNDNDEQTDVIANLFVGNLSWNIDEEWLTREFEEFGELKGVRVITDRDSGRSKGFGYVEFTDASNAAAALEAKHESMLDGRNIRVDFSQPRPQRSDGFTPQQRSGDRAQRFGDSRSQPSSTLFVGNIPFSADENMVTEIFQELGYVKAVRMPTDRESGALKGYGYVEMSSVDEAQAALEALQGGDLAGRPMRLDFASERSSNDSPRGGFGGRGRGRGGGFGGDRGDRGGRGGFSRGGFNDRGRGRGAPRGGRGGTTNRGGFGDFSGKKMTF